MAGELCSVFKLQQFTKTGSEVWCR